MRDVADPVASSALQVGGDRAVGRAAAAVGPDTLGAALPRLQPWALSGTSRSGLKAQPRLLDEIRRRIDSM